MILDDSASPRGRRPAPATPQAVTSAPPTTKVKQDQVGQKNPLDPRAELACPAFEQSGSGGQLPAGDPLAEGPFQDRPGEDGPQNSQPDFGAGHARGQQIARTDARRGKQDAGEQQRIGRGLAVAGHGCSLRFRCGNDLHRLAGALVRAMRSEMLPAMARKASSARTVLAELDRDDFAGGLQLGVFLHDILDLDGLRVLRAAGQIHGSRVSHDDVVGIDN